LQTTACGGVRIPRQQPVAAQEARLTDPEKAAADALQAIAKLSDGLDSWLGFAPYRDDQVRSAAAPPRSST